MNDITHKINTLRVAIAEANVLLGSEATAEAIRTQSVPKGNVFEFARAAALLAVKNTSNVIPDCHPLPVESCKVTSELQGLNIVIQVEVKTIYRTGVEVEAMHGASIAALTMYDMLKPIDKNIEIQNIKLLHKKGGKSDFTDIPKRPVYAAVVVCSDTVAAGKKEDKAGLKISEILKSYGIEISSYTIISDDATQIAAAVQAHCAPGTDLLIFTGGTGLSPRDITPETVAPLLDREVPGMMEAARKYGQDRMPYAMVSRGVAGFKGKTLVITTPGSTRGAEETMQALFPYVLHLFRVAEGAQHG
ncbi:MAG: bifunctional molybdenum cofactor biosynthesis protein MoaC/MoaB [Bacteroidia bacterium]|jgi:molybdenum cofactor biosynthesis protein MoaC